jgi:putative hydrolase of the HAD superfamily
MTSKYKHILFDLDNTLWDFETNSENTLREMFVKYELNKAFDSFVHFHNLYVFRNTQLWYSYHNKQINKKFLNFERFNYPLQQVGIDNPELVNTLSFDYLQVCAMQKTLMPHANETLEYLKGNRYHMHILSNGFEEVQYLKLKHSGLDKYFEHIILSEKAGALKPDKRIFDYAITSLNARKKEVIMIGDNFEADIEGAKNAGIDQLYYNPKGQAPISFNPTHTVTSLSEIMSIL